MKKKALVNKQYLLQQFPGKGGWTYAAIPEIKPDKKNPFGWVKVKGSIDNIPFCQYHLMSMGNGQLFLPVKAVIRKQLKKRAGDWVSVEIFLDNDPVTIPEELLQCLMDEPAALKKFNKMSDSEKTTAIKHIYAVKKEETRAARIVQLTRSLLQS